MRVSSGFTLQQSLSSDSSSIIKQAVTLAHRRGHAQVTPLHVANTMLSSSTSLFRTVCVQSQSRTHPLRCKALELCFNVALNRLPTSSCTSSPNYHSSTRKPSISNALVAAFKRAQAHQRRGTIENQPQHGFVAVKIEVKQLIISILDDPSVSRVMREAGFSSTQVKTNLEHVASLEVCTQTHPFIASKKASKFATKDCMKQNSKDSSDRIRNEDVTCVIESLLDKKRSRSRSVCVVGECVSTIEGVIGKVMEKVEKGEVPEALKGVKFISLPLVSFGQLSRVDLEQKIVELRSLVKGFGQRGVVLYLGDLKCINEFRNISPSSCGHVTAGRYCPIEHLIMELARIICGVNQDDKVNVKLWVMAISSFQTFMKCRNGNPSLEVAWKLHPVTIPVGSLSLSLVPQSDIHSECGSQNNNNGVSQMMCENGEEKRLANCVDCSMNFESEAKSLKSSSLPPWLSNEQVVVNNQDHEYVSIKELCKKWNSICTSLHKNKPLFERSLSLSSVSPSSQASCFSYTQENPNPNRNSKDLTSLNIEPYDPRVEGGPRQGFPSNPNSTPTSFSSSEVMEVEYMQKFREFNGKNMEMLCNALEEKVPWKKDIVPDIAGTILKCRSRMVRRKEKQNMDIEPKEETWFLFKGINSRLKEKICKELANIVFGSYSNLITIALNKVSRDEQRCSYLETFVEEVSTNPHRVFLIQNVDQANYSSQMEIKQAIERGKLTRTNGEEVGFYDAIIVLSCESFSWGSRPRSSTLRNDQGCQGVSLDLNILFEEEHEDELGLLECVDKCINFNIQDLSL